MIPCSCEPDHCQKPGISNCQNYGSDWNQGNWDPFDLTDEDRRRLLDKHIGPRDERKIARFSEEDLDRARTEARRQALQEAVQAAERHLSKIDGDPTKIPADIRALA